MYSPTFRVTRDHRRFPDEMTNCAKSKSQDELASYKRLKGDWSVQKAISNPAAFLCVICTASSAIVPAMAMTTNTSDRPSGGAEVLAHKEAYA